MIHCSLPQHTSKVKTWTRLALYFRWWLENGKHKICIPNYELLCFSLSSMWKCVAIFPHILFYHRLVILNLQLKATAGYRLILDKTGPSVLYFMSCSKINVDLLVLDTSHFTKIAAGWSNLEWNLVLIFSTRDATSFPFSSE